MNSSKQRLARPAAVWLFDAALCSAVLCAAMSGQAASAQPPSAAATGAEESAEQMERLLAKLSSNQYIQRETATLKLAGFGHAAVPVLVRGVTGADLETTERAMQLLERLALSEQPTDPPVAWEAISTLAASGNGTAASRAKSALQAVSLHRQTMAREHLAAEGITVGLSNVVLEASAINEEVVYVPPTWSGKAKDLRWLAWLHHVSYAAVEGVSINRQVLEQITRMPDLKNVIITDTDLNSAELQPLTTLERLDQLEIRYTPIDDSAIELIKRLPLRQKLILNGTKITPEGVETLRRELPGLPIVFKRGGFLGVRCDPFAPRCQITLVLDGSAAEVAGMRAGDIVTRVGERRIGRFADLQDAIGEYSPGEAIPIAIDRGGQKIEVVAELGTMDSEDD